MALFLLDSDVVIDILKGVATTAAIVSRLSEDAHLLCTCDIVLTEIHTGLSEEARDVAVPILHSLFFLVSGREIAERAGRWRYMFARQGIAVALTDSIIAATAVEWNATVVTGNVRDYPMRELAVLPVPRRSR